MSLYFCCDIQMVGSEFGVKNMKSMDPSCLVSMVQAGGGGVGDIFLTHFGHLSTNRALFKCHSLPEYCCWPCPYLYDYSVPIFWCYFQKNNAPCHKAQIISDWFLEHDNDFTLLKWPPQSHLMPKEHLWDVVEREIRIMDVQLTNLWQLCDVFKSIWTKISGMFPTPCWIYAIKNWGCSEGKRGFNLVQARYT